MIELSPMEAHPEHFAIVEDFDDKKIIVELLQDETFKGDGTARIPDVHLSAGTQLSGFADVARDGTLCIVTQRVVCALVAV